MNKIVAAILAMGFASVAVFGFFAMAHSMSHTNCIAATLNGRVCTATDVFGVAAYHLSAFQKAAQADLPGTLTLLTVFAAILLGLFAAKNWILPLAAGLRTGVPPQKFPIPQANSFWRWLSFHENSPNFSF